MAQGDRKTAQTADNPNKSGVGANKGDLQPGDITWITPPPEPPKRVNGKAGDATRKALSKGQRRDLARRIRAKLSRKS